MEGNMTFNQKEKERYVTILFYYQGFLLSVLVSAVCADFTGLARGGHDHDHMHAHEQTGGLARTGRQEDGTVSGGVDFSGCETDPDTGLCLSLIHI